MRFNAVALGLAAFLFASPLAAQTATPPPYGAPITLEAGEEGGCGSRGRSRQE